MKTHPESVNQKPQTSGSELPEKSDETCDARRNKIESRLNIVASVSLFHASHDNKRFSSSCKPHDQATTTSVSLLHASHTSKPHKQSRVSLLHAIVHFNLKHASARLHHASGRFHTRHLTSQEIPIPENWVLKPLKSRDHSELVCADGIPERLLPGQNQKREKDNTCPRKLAGTKSLLRHCLQIGMDPSRTSERFQKPKPQNALRKHTPENVIQKPQTSGSELPEKSDETCDARRNEVDSRFNIVASLSLFHASHNNKRFSSSCKPHEQATTTSVSLLHASHTSKPHKQSRVSLLHAIVHFNSKHASTRLHHASGRFHTRHLTSQEIAIPENWVLKPLKSRDHSEVVPGQSQKREKDNTCPRKLAGTKSLLRHCLQIGMDPSRTSERFQKPKPQNALRKHTPESANQNPQTSENELS